MTTSTTTPATGLIADNVIGFARFHLGEAEPSNLVELVVQPNTAPAALECAQAIFGGAGLEVAVCRDFPVALLERLGGG